MHLKTEKQVMHNTVPTASQESALDSCLSAATVNNSCVPCGSNVTIRVCVCVCPLQHWEHQLHFLPDQSLSCPLSKLYEYESSMCHHPSAIRKMYENINRQTDRQREREGGLRGRSEREV